MRSVGNPTAKRLVISDKIETRKAETEKADTHTHREKMRQNSTEKTGYFCGIGLQGVEYLGAGRRSSP